MTDTQNKWIDVEKELPPCDGLYEVTNDKTSQFPQHFLTYDGIGFLYGHIYRPIRFWRYNIKLEKRYGKIDD